MSKKDLRHIAVLAKRLGVDLRMNIAVRGFEKQDIADANLIWNQVVEEGVAFPQLDFLDETSGMEFFESQTYTGIAYDEETGKVVGLYILHPNNVGRCGHISNASYAVLREFRGHRIGEILVKHCLDKAKEMGFQIMQFNAVVKSNTRALALYKKLGFVQLGIIPKGFLLKDGTYEDIVPHYYIL